MGVFVPSVFGLAVVSGLGVGMLESSIGTFLVSVVSTAAELAGGSEDAMAERKSRYYWKSSACPLPD